MADKYHNAWIIRQIVTAYRICMAEDRTYRFVSNTLCDKKKAMLSTIYGCMARNPCKTIMELTGDYFIYCDTDSKICQTLTAGGARNVL